MANKSKKAMTVKAEGNNGKEEQKKITAKPEPKKITASKEPVKIAAKEEPKKLAVKQVEKIEEKKGVKSPTKKTSSKKSEVKKTTKKAAVKKTTSKKTTKKAKLSVYESWSLEECISKLQAMNVHHVYEDYAHFLLDEPDVKIIEKNIIEGNGIDKADYDFDKHGYDKDLVMVTLNKVADTMDIKAKDFKEINTYAKSKGFEIIVDVSPRVFNQLGISYQDLTFFKDIGADGLRLDMGFTGNEEAIMTFNPYDLKIEINMSNDVHTIDTIMDYKPNRYNLYACHNFYPHGYTGLGLEFFENCTKRFSKYGLRTAAFVTSQNKDTFGSWPVTEGLPTLEMHRHLPMDVQIKHFIAMDSIDDILISNCYPTDEEIDKVKGLDLSLLTLDVELYKDTPEIEQKILFEELHFNRGDQNENMIRSTQSRVKYKGHHFALFHAPEIIRRGDVIIESSEYGHYAGELQIALHDMKNSGKTNVVGHIRKEEHFLLDYIKPWQKFRLRKVK